jgi:hypothetical protein
MYQDVLIAIHHAGDEVRASVWRRHFPEGRQRRQQVATYVLRDLGPVPSPIQVVEALGVAMRERPDYVI